MFTRFGMPCCAAALCLLGFVNSSSAANPRTTNPSNAAPDSPLAIHGDDASVKLHEECAEGVATLAKFVPPMLQRIQSGQGKIDPDHLADCIVASARLDRLGRHLVLLGEPAGHEFGLRVAYFRGPLRLVLDGFNNSPAGMQHATKVRQQLTKTERERALTLKKLSELVEKKQYEEAERVWFALDDKLRGLLAFLPPSEATAYLQPFNEISTHILNTMYTQRSAAADQWLTARRDSLRPNVAQFTAAVAATAQALAKADRVPIDGGSLTGPEAFLYYAAAWQKMHAAAIRCQGLTWALQAGRHSMPVAGGGAVGGPMMTPTVAATDLKNDPVLDEYVARSASQISAALAGLAAAEATRVAPADAPALYLAWLDAAAGLTGRVQGDTLARALDPALRQIAARSPEFLAQVNAYDTSTRELLRWKRRTAEAAVASVVAQQPALDVAFRQAFAANAQSAGLFPMEKPESMPPMFHGAAPIVLPPGAERLLKQSVVLQAGQALANGKAGVTRLHQRVFATYRPSAESLAAAVAGLQTELFVTPERPPLTLAAASALRSLQLGDFTAAGGEVTGIYLEGCLTRVAGLPDAAWPLVPLGDLPTLHMAERGGVPQLDRVVARVEVEPKWWRHEYVIVPLAAPQ